VNNHFWGLARKRALKRDERSCVTCGGMGPGLQVHHIDPRRGAGYAAGCHHHLDLLETLCHACHVEVTNVQRRTQAAAG
jgi:5-methylcytosine-specific restriction endonuclease McrA